MGQKKKVKLFKKTTDINKDMNKSLTKLGSSLGGAFAYRVGKNMFIKDITDDKKKARMEQLVTLGAIASGAAGVIASDHNIIQSVSNGMFTVASLDFINKNFGDKISGMLGATLGEVADNNMITQHIVVEPEPEYQPGLPDNTTSDPVDAEIDKLLAETEEKQLEGIDTADTDDNEEIVLEKLN